ncbi:hypothetical protein [Lysobacter sp. Root983]|uniref:hypothetical protein n=1 Tax=Lysobacter sp. Root983 TaxID=1736613 RepID=UPI00070F1E37|nr:hypothetical protein [Lysobacter sp. Root983]KRD72743.1 hypothetical protein ASE43_19175 [Lysobacter sp. Root983]
MSSDTRTQDLKPGDVLNIDNGGSVGMRVKITTPAQTVIESELAPGARLKITAGAEPLGIHVETADDGYRGLTRVK